MEKNIATATTAGCGLDKPDLRRIFFEGAQQVSGGQLRTRSRVRVATQEREQHGLNELLPRLVQEAAAAADPRRK